MKMLKRFLAIGGMLVGIVAFAAAAQMTAGCGGGGGSNPAGNDLIDNGGGDDGGEALAVPTGLSVEAGYGQVTVSWDMVSGFTYNLYWATSSGAALPSASPAKAGAATATKIENVTSPYLHAVDCGAHYYYVLTAASGDEESAASAEVSATPGPVGVLDTSFASGGTFQYRENEQDAAMGLAVDPEGRVVVAGAKDMVMATWRLTEEGELDPTYGTDGITTYPVVGRGSIGLNVALDAQGRIVVAGYEFDEEQNILSLDVWRYTSAGVLDASFASGGVYQDSPAGIYGNIGLPVGLAIDASGRIFVAGGVENGDGGLDVAVWRLDENGNKDWEKSPRDAGGQEDVAVAAAVDSEGRVVIVGVRTGEGAFLLRLTEDGELDPAFNPEGDEPGVVTSGAGWAFGLDIDASGRILISGFNPFAGTTFAQRYTSEGALDTSFGTGGTFSQAGIWGFTTLVDALGGVVLAIDGSDGVKLHPGLTRLIDTGVVDTEFGTDGQVMDNVDGNDHHFWFDDLLISHVIATDSFGRIYMGMTEDRGGAGTPDAGVFVQRFK